MNTYSMKIVGNYQEVGNAIGAFLGENKEAEQVLFEGVDGFKTLDLQLAPMAGDDPDLMIAIIKFETSTILPEDNVDTFALMFENSDVKTLVVQ